MTGRILIVDGVATNRVLLKAKLRQAFYEALTACDPASCLGIARESSPDLILLDWSFPDNESLALLRDLRNCAKTRTLPIIVTMANHSLSDRLDALAAGADEVMQKPLDERFLMARLRSLLRAQEGSEEVRAQEATLGILGMGESAEAFARPGLFTVVTANSGLESGWVKALSGLLDHQVTVQNPDEVLLELRQPRGRSPDLFLVEAGPGMQDASLRLLSDLKSRRAFRNTAMGLMLPEMDLEAAKTAFDLGAHVVVTSSVEPAELAIRLDNLLCRKRLDDRIRASVRNGMKMAVTDPLTGLFNRRYGLAQLDKLLETARTGDGPLAVMVIDLDRFKLVNDGLGHAAGDAVLVEVARRLSAELRESDLIARIGGEEFLVATPRTDLAEGQLLAARLCKAVQCGPIRVGGATQVSVTASIGLTVSDESDLEEREHAALVVGRADQALLRAKAGGRNQVTVARNAA